MHTSRQIAGKWVVVYMEFIKYIWNNIKVNDGVLNIKFL